MTYQQKVIKLIGQSQKDLAKAAIDNAPLNQNVEVVIRETPKTRTPDANSLMWAGALKDISEQVWLNGRQYSAEIFHEYFKGLFLVDENDDPYPHEHVKNIESYKKYDYTPNGERVLVGSTTELTPYGFSQYLEQIHAWGAANGVLFHSNPKDLQR